MHELFKTYEFGPRLGIEVGAFDTKSSIFLKELVIKVLQQLNS